LPLLPIVCASSNSILEYWSIKSSEHAQTVCRGVYCIDTK
jgi:hypothetical protein